MSDQSAVGFDVSWVPSVAIILGSFISFGNSLEDFRNPLKDAVANVVAPSIRKNFDVGGRPPWEPLAESTETQRDYKGIGGGILVASGELRKVASSMAPWTFQDDVAFVNQLPGGVFYGEIHQEGSETEPARPFMMLQDEDMDKIEETIDNWLVHIGVEHGFGTGEGL